MSFTKDFLWGSASAAYQIEGAANTHGKGPSIWDEFSHIEGNTFKNTNGDIAIDFYNRFEEDIELMREMNLKAYRFSISWPRILPNGYGQINQKGIDFYHKVIEKLLECGIEPILTIYHWDLPKKLQDEYLGWEDRKIIDHFVDYCEILFKEYGSKVKYWVSINEQNIFTSLGYLQKLHPPKINDFQRFLNANHNANIANARSIQLFRKIVPSYNKIGASFAYSPKYANSSNPIDVIAKEDAQELMDYLWLDVYCLGRYSKIALSLLEKKGFKIPIMEGDEELLLDSKPDFIGINYYQTTNIESFYGNSNTISPSKNTVISSDDHDEKENKNDDSFRIIKNEFLKLTDWNWTIDPIGLEVGLRRLYSRYNLPILISENGLGAFDKLENDLSIKDHYRIDYLKQHIQAIDRAINVGVEVIGYCTWSFQDLFSWLNGYQKRYGFVFIDRDEESEKELKRYKKNSFYWYKKVIESNGKNL